MLQAFEGIIIMAFLQWVICAVPFAMAILTLFACCFGKSKCFRVFIFIVNIVRAIGSVLFYIVFSIFVFNI